MTIDSVDFAFLPFVVAQKCRDPDEMDIPVAVLRDIFLVLEAILIERFFARLVHFHVNMKISIHSVPAMESATESI